MNLTLENLLIIVGSSIVFSGSCTFLWFICKDIRNEQSRRDTTITDVLLIDNVEV